MIPVLYFVIKVSGVTKLNTAEYKFILIVVFLNINLLLLYCLTHFIRLVKFHGIFNHRDSNAGLQEDNWPKISLRENRGAGKHFVDIDSLDLNLDPQGQR